MSGTIIVTLILVLIVSAVIASMNKDRRNNKHPSFGGSCSSCGHSCERIFAEMDAIMEKQKSLENKSCRK
ncbi:MAG: FeoB-associated Cys-rich membrane protein [Treponema sp.]|nr:FeoB-associated Cys-rich membrane protein [Treponema sp.]